MAVRSVEPRRGPAGGGTYVNVTGAGFSPRAAQLGYVWCRFNATRAAAFWLSVSELHCIAPAHAVGAVGVEVTVNEQQYTSDGARFEYAPLALQSVHPVSGPVVGGTLVEVTYVFGPRLPKGGRCVTSDRELDRLAARKSVSQGYVVEVCTGCRWNHLTESRSIGGS